MTLHGWMSYLGQGHADTGTDNLLSSFLQRTALGQMEHCSSALPRVEKHCSRT